MSFTMSGSGSWSYNRFDEYEAKLKAQKEAEAAAEETTEELSKSVWTTCLKGDVGHERHKKAMADNQSAIDAANKRIAKMGIQYPTGKKQKTSVAKRKEAEAAKTRKEEVEHLEEGGMHREADTGKVVDKAEVGKIYYPNQPKKQTSVAKRKEAAKLKKEDLEATGLFSAEEIEALLEASCGSKGYQKGGEVKCEKCGGKGCDACEKKKDEKKGKSGGSKPDYLDFDKDGNKDEPMKDALKSKKGKKEDEEGEEGGEGAVSESVTATQRSNSFADAYASMYEAAPLAAMAGKALAGGAKLAGKAALAGGKAAVKGAASAAASAATAPKETESAEE